MAWSIVPRTFRPHRATSLKNHLRPIILRLSSSGTSGQFQQRWEWSNQEQSPESCMTNPEPVIHTPGKSHITAPGNKPLHNITVGKLAERGANKYGSRPAVISLYEQKSITYADLLEQADNLAAGLLSLGLKRGDRVGLWGPNSLDWVICKIAIVRAGLVLVTLNPAYQAPELKYGLATVRAKAIICAQSFRIQNFPEILSKVVPNLASFPIGEIRSNELPDLRVAIIMSDTKVPGFLRLQDAKHLGSASTKSEVLSLQDQISPKEVCEIQYTSGTTGQPKGCMLSHYSMTNNAIIAGKEYCLLEREQIEAGEVPEGQVLHQNILVSIPFFHVYASVVGILNPIYYGNTVVLASPLYTPESMMKALHSEKISMLMTAPTMLVDLLNILKSGAPAPEALRYVTSGGGMATAELLRGLQKALPKTFIGQGYGMTETSTALCLLPLGSTQEQRENTVGKFLPHTEAKVVDSEGKIVPLGQPGELMVRGYMTTRGYWEDEKKTQELLEPDGWLHTGDLFKIREDGYAAILGRIKEMIVRGGENVYPKEVENAIEEHPDVMEALVFPVSDKRLGEEVACVVRLRNGSLSHDELKKHLKDKIAYFKIPRYSRVVENVPRTAAGKPQKFKLREMMEEYIRVSKIEPK